MQVVIGVDTARFQYFGDKGGGGAAGERPSGRAVCEDAGLKISFQRVTRPAQLFQRLRTIGNEKGNRIVDAVAIKGPGKGLTDDEFRAGIFQRGKALFPGGAAAEVFACQDTPAG